MSSSPDPFQNSFDSHEPGKELGSPFLNEEYLFEEARAAQWRTSVPEFQLESPFLQAFEEELLIEQEVIGQDTRVLIKNTLEVPYRWICAIDILIDNPKWGSFGESQFISKSRATGILIGPRYVLTARHILDKQTIEVDGEEKLVDVKELTVSPARNGSNFNNPFGKVKSKAVRVSQPYRIVRRVNQGSKVIDIPFQQQDDYALIILERDLDSSTHSKMKGILGYWGYDSAVAIVRELKLKDIEGKEIVVLGYPGDTCGKNKFSGSKTEKEKKIANCWNRQGDEWASTQWRDVGMLQVESNSTNVFHTADTYEGQSGAPIYLTVDQKLHLVGVHTSPDSAQRNKGVRVTRRMLLELCQWINTDSGYTMASIQNDALVVQLKDNTGAKEFFDGFARAAEDFSLASEWMGLSEEEAEYEQMEEFETFGHLRPETFQKGSLETWIPRVDQEALYESDTPAALSQVITNALSKKDWALALRLAIQEGWRDENELTNLILFARHPELLPGKLDPKDPKFKQLSGEWTKILNNEVWKAIQASAENTDLVVSGEEVTDLDRFFWGMSGKRLKKLVEDAAREVDLNPGLLGAIMMAETRRPQSYLSSEKVSTFHIGADNFYEARTAIKERVPAYTKVKWDKTQTPIEHDTDSIACKKKAKAQADGDKTTFDKYSKLCTKVKTIWLDSGPDGVLATAVYVKLREVRLREIATKLKKNFDSLPIATQFALTRMAMAAGTAGATPFLKDALKEVDIFIRKAIPVKIYQTQRNATVRTAQAMHLSDWIFGIPVPSTAAQPELEAFEDFNTAEFGNDEFEDDAEASYRDVEYERAEDVGHLDYETNDEEANDDIAKEAKDEGLLEYETQEEFLKRLRDVAESQSGVRLSYKDYPVTKKDLKGRSSKNNPWRQTTIRQRFNQLEADGSFCLGASRAMAFRTLFGLDKPSYRQVLTNLNKQIEEARKSKDEDTEARLIISRIVSHSHDPGSMTQFNQDIRMRYGIKNVMVRNASRKEALSALKQGAPIIADLRGGWHWVLVQQSRRGGLMANDPLDGADVRAIKKEDLGDRFELIVNATTDDVITPNKANDHKNDSG
jgi:V8-like Glu-specific endopeptidase